jgi:outer membrane protein
MQRDGKEKKAMTARMCFSVAALLALLFVFQVSLLAAEQESPADPSLPRLLSVESCIRIALKNNFTMMDSMEQLLEKEADYYIAKNTLTTRAVASYAAGSNSVPQGFDQLRARGELTYKLPEGDTITATAEELKTSFTTNAGHDLSLQYRYPLAKGNGLIVGSKEIRRTQRNLTIQEMQYFLSKQDVVQNVLRRYFAVLQARKVIEVSENNVQISRENLRVTKRRYEEGMVPKLDVTRAEMNLLEAEDSLLGAKKQWADARDDLITAIGLDSRKSAEIDYDVPYVPRDFQEEECIDLSMLLRKEVLVRGEELFQVKENEIIAKDALKPQVDLVTTYGATRTEFLYSTVMSSQPPMPTWSAMVEMSIDISKRSLREELLKQKRLIVLYEERLADKKRDIVKEVRSGLRQIRLSANRVEIRERSLKAAEERVHLATRSWEEGLINNRELLDAQQLKVQAQVALLNSKIEYILAEYDLKKAIGFDLYYLISQEQHEMPRTMEDRKSSIDAFLGIGTH